MPKPKLKIKIKRVRETPEDFPKDPSLYRKACLMIKALKGTWEVKKGKVIIAPKKKNKKAKKKSFDLR